MLGVGAARLAWRLVLQHFLIACRDPEARAVHEAKRSARAGARRARDSAGCWCPCAQAALPRRSEWRPAAPLCEGRAGCRGRGRGGYGPRVTVRSGVPMSLGAEVRADFGFCSGPIAKVPGDFIATRWDRRSPPRFWAFGRRVREALVVSGHARERPCRAVARRRLRCRE